MYELQIMFLNLGLPIGLADFVVAVLIIGGNYLFIRLFLFGIAYDREWRKNKEYDALKTGGERKKFREWEQRRSVIEQDTWTGN